MRSGDGESIWVDGAMLKLGVSGVEGEGCGKGEGCGSSMVTTVGMELWLVVASLLSVAA